MYKIGLMSLDSRNYNYGGILQEYALQSTIKSLGNDCTVIDYKQNTELRMFSPRRSIRNLTWEKINSKLKQLNCNKRDDQQIEEVVVKRKSKFDDFCKMHIKFSEPCSHQELHKIVLDYDAIVCGSDQIWNPAFSRPSLFLDFVPDSIGKVIYAASVARDALTNNEKTVYKEYIKPLEWISVREAEAVELLQQISDDKEIKLVLDPTLLVSCAHWRELAGTERLLKDKYIFCYFLGIDEEKRKAAQEFASWNGLKIISIPYLLRKYNPLDDGFSYIEFDVGPVEFLNLILHADFVLTDSFHASVFSILFQKNFRVFGRTFGKSDMNTRIRTLLKYINCEEYLISPDQLQESIKVENKERDIEGIKERREESMEWLKMALTNSIMKKII